MGVRYVAVNHDKKALFVMEKLLDFHGYNEETFESFVVKPQTEEEMIAYVWSAIDPAHNYTKDFTYEDAVRMGKDLFAFDVQEVFTTDDLYDDEEKYGEYIYTHSLWENDSEIGRRADHYWETYFNAQDDGPPLVGQLGVMEDITVHTDAPKPGSFEYPFFKAGDAFVVRVLPPESSIVGSRQLNVGWELLSPKTFAIPTKKYVKNRTYVSKRLQKIRNRRIEFTCEETKSGHMLHWLEGWQQNFIDDLQSQVQANAEKLDKQSEEIAKLLQG